MRAPLPLLRVDVDPRHGGDRTLAQLVDRHGRLPRTPTSQTGSGGLHVPFAWPDGGGIRASAGKLGPGIDVRGEGGYLVLPPSPHASGCRYRWLIALGQTPLAPAPVWLLELVRNTSRPSRPPAAAPLKIPRGHWHNALVSLGGVMRRWGACEEVLDAAAVALAEHQFLHDDGKPIDWEHVHKTAAAIARRY